MSEVDVAISQMLMESRWFDGKPAEGESFPKSISFKQTEMFYLRGEKNPVCSDLAVLG